MMLYKNGDIYSGEWQFNKRHGYGKFLLKDKGEYDKYKRTINFIY